jgi:MFS transporter, PPP family, 3-phenylpropionic acid transporter
VVFISKADALQMKKTVPFIFYLLFYAAGSFTMPNIVLYFQEIGFSGVQIGLLAGMAPLITMVGAPFWTGLADVKKRHKLIMSLTIVGAILCNFIFPFAKALLTVILLVFLFSLISSPIISLADSATMTMLVDEKNKYGRVRLGGTIGWGLMAPLASIIIFGYGIKWAFWGYAAVMIFVLIVSQKLTFGQHLENMSLKWDLRKILTNQRWVHFLILALVGGVAFASINSYLFPYMEELGISRSMFGISLLISTIGELPILFFSNRLLKRFGSYRLLLIGMTLTGVRLLLYAWLRFPMGIFIFQILNGMTFPMVWVAGVSYADENAPVGMKATAQGLFGAMVFGIGAAIGGLMGGLMIGSIGGQWMYLIIGSLVLICVGLISLVERAKHTQPDIAES